MSKEAQPKYVTRMPEDTPNSYLSMLQSIAMGAPPTQAARANGIPPAVLAPILLDGERRATYLSLDATPISDEVKERIKKEAGEDNGCDFSYHLFMEFNRAVANALQFMVVNKFTEPVKLFTLDEFTTFGAASAADSAILKTAGATYGAIIGRFTKVELDGIEWKKDE